MKKEGKQRHSVELGQGRVGFYDVTNHPEGQDGELSFVGASGLERWASVDVFLVLERLITSACEGERASLDAYGQLVLGLSRWQAEHGGDEPIVAALVAFPDVGAGKSTPR